MIFIAYIKTKTGSHKLLCYVFKNCNVEWLECVVKFTKKSWPVKKQGQQIFSIFIIVIANESNYASSI